MERSTDSCTVKVSSLWTEVPYGIYIIFIDSFAMIIHSAYDNVPLKIGSLVLSNHYLIWLFTNLLSRVLRRASFIRAMCVAAIFCIHWSPTITLWAVQQLCSQRAFRRGELNSIIGFI